jgi:gliding motility-associated-like protein
MKQFLTIIGVLFGFVLNGQLYVKGGGTVLTVSSNCVLFVDDLVVVEQDATVSLSGEISLNGSLVNQGLFNHQGTIQVSGNFIQDGELNAIPSSEFQLTGTEQFISGSNPIELGRLSCSGDGLKTLNQTVRCERLEINNSRIFTQSDSLIVLQGLPDAVSRNNGWVYSSLNGGLFRNLVQGEAADFPVGNESDYRPLQLNATAGNGLVGLRFADVSAGSDGIPLTFITPGICRIDDRFYFRIYGNVGSIDVSASFEQAFTEGFIPWANVVADGQSQWSSSNVTSSFQNDSLITQWSVNLLNGLAISPYLSRPESPEIQGPDTLCFKSNVVEYETLELPQGWDYLWSASGGQVSGSSNQPMISVDWDESISGNVSLVVSDNNGCSSFPASLNVFFNTLPEAAFSIVAPDYPHTGENFSFVNESIGGLIYNWNFGNGESSNAINPVEDFEEPGFYLVNLLVVDENGCRDSVRQEVQIPEELIFPDAFSPNGDGVNDVLQIQSSGMKQYSLQIFDRWGNLLFETNKPGFHWDGRTASGELVPAGTYFVLLRAEGKSKIFEKRTSVSVFY